MARGRSTPPAARPPAAPPPPAPASPPEATTPEARAFTTRRATVHRRRLVPAGTTLPLDRAAFETFRAAGIVDGAWD